MAILNFACLRVFVLFVMLENNSNIRSEVVSGSHADGLASMVNKEAQITRDSEKADDIPHDLHQP
jgi:hypothetical protein